MSPEVADGFFTTSTTWEAHVGCIYIYVYNCCIFNLDWSFDHYVIPSLSLVTVFVLKYSFPDIIITTLAFFWFPCIELSSFILFTFSLFVFLDLLLVMLHWSLDWYSVCQVIHYKITLFLTSIPYILEGRKYYMQLTQTEWGVLLHFPKVGVSYKLCRIFRCKRFIYFLPVIYLLSHAFLSV